MPKQITMPYFPTLEDLERELGKGLPDARRLRIPPVTVPSLRGVHDPQQGISLNEARYWFAPDNLLQRVAEIKTSINDSFPPRENLREYSANFQARNSELRHAIQGLEDNLMRGLRSGDLFSTGYGSAAPLDAKPQRIRADRWRTLTPQFAASMAVASGMTVTGILVFDPKTVTNAKLVGVFSTAKLEAWYREWIAENSAKGTIPSRDQDWAWAKLRCGPGVTRNAVRILRIELSPPDWTKKGRRKTTL